MNTSGDSTSSALAGSPVSGYVSCIKVDGRPILPPVMNESVRAEMRRYRELALQVENSLRLQKRSRNKRPSAIPVNTTVTLESSDFSENSCSADDEEMAASPSEVSMVDAGNAERIEGISAYDNHFRIKKPSEIEDSNVLSCIEEISEKSGESSKAEFRGSETYTKSPGESIVENMKEDEVDNPVTDEDDHKSEAMSLVSVEDKFQEDDIGSDSDFSIENYPPADTRSGRSSTETFIIERHHTSDTENNNENDVLSEPKYFFSPARDEGNTSIIFNAEKPPNTVKSRKYFHSPTSPGEVVLSEVSITTSIASASSTTTESGSNSSVQDYSGSSFHTPRSSCSSKAGVARKFYFTSPETSPPQVSAPTENDTVTSKFTETAMSLSMSAPTPPSRLLTPTNTNIVHEGLKSPVKRIENSSPVMRMASPTKIPGRIAGTKITSSPVKSRAKSPETCSVSNFTFTKSSPSPKKKILLSSWDDSDSYTLTSAQQSSGSEMVTSSQRTPSQIVPIPIESKAHSAPAKPTGAVKNIMAQSTSGILQTSVQTAPSTGQLQLLGRVNLSTLQSAMMNLSPNVFRTPPDARSPLLKGLVLSDAMFRPKRELRIPPQALDPAMQPKFERVSAAAKGFLVRRLLKTEKLQTIIQMIRDTVELVLKLYEEVPQLKVRGWKGVKHEDADLCRRLFQQLTGACSSFHDVFFKLTTAQRMAIIANDREKIRAKEMKSYLSRSQSVRGPRSKQSGRSGAGHSKRKISTATAKCLQRRMSVLS